MPSLHLRPPCRALGDAKGRGGSGTCPGLPRGSVLRFGGFTCSQPTRPVSSDSSPGSSDCMNRFLQEFCFVGPRRPGGCRPSIRRRGEARPAEQPWGAFSFSARVRRASNPATPAGPRLPLTSRVGLLLGWVLAIAPGCCSLRPRV